MDYRNYPVPPRVRIRGEQSVCTRGLQPAYEAMAIRIYTIHLVKTQIMVSKGQTCLFLVQYL